MWARRVRLGMRMMNLRYRLRAVALDRLLLCRRKRYRPSIV